MIGFRGLLKTQSVPNAVNITTRMRSVKKMMQMTEIDKNTIFFLYGSLRKGFQNHDLIQDKALFKGKAKIMGYRLYSLGSYPAIYPSNRQDDYVFGELYQIQDEDVIKRMHRMEIGAGYKLVKEKCYIDEKNTMTVAFYQYKDATVTRNKRIESGDWGDKD